MKNNKQFIELRRKLWAYRCPPLTLTIEDVFAVAPETEDFKWDDTDVGDATVYYCEDCKRYHKYYINWEIGRKDGKKYIYKHVGDEDGNWDVEEAWEEGEDAGDILFSMQNEINEYFKGWANYDLDCAETGKDMMTGEPVNKKKSLLSAEENIKYLYQE